MTTKVLVFESDPAFAEELRTELGMRGCTTTVVDDGNLGLQQAASENPDLVLLSIELPRMNGFSVCNKLKKDPNLKDVPLIIMSSESTDETFEQHKKLRTRAEDYVHKPIAFADLLTHIEKFLTLAEPHRESDAPIVIEDEIEVGSADYLLEEEAADEGQSRLPIVGLAGFDSESSNAAEGAAQAEAQALRPADSDVEAFAESAFGRLTGLDAQALSLDARATPNGSGGPELGTGGASRGSIVPPPARRSSLRPPPSSGDFAERERLRAEVIVVREQLETAQRELLDARREVDRLRFEADEAGRLSREADELRARLANAVKTGGTSSRDFLDLREALNRKDKEILAFREQLSRKDREIVESQDRALGLERAKADLEERLLLVERQLAETKESVEELASERDAAKKGADDLRSRAEKAKGDAEARERQLSELRARNADERAASEVRLAAVRAELDQLLANERAEHARALDQAEQRRRAEVDELRRERDGALVSAREQVERETQDALSAQSAQLWQDHEAKVLALQRAHAQEIDRVRDEAADATRAAIDEQHARHSEELKALGDDRDARLAALENRAQRDLAEAREALAKAQEELDSARSEFQSLIDRRRAEEAASQGRVAELEQRLMELQGARDALDHGLAAANDRAEALQKELEALRRELADAKERLAAEITRGDHTRAKWDADRQSLDRAKDALALALAQIEETEARPLT
ncbi:MAG TPA: response regulator [Polyangiaceae bacterium]|nr:response regulator [Polyangiaceae bacterium]